MFSKVFFFVKYISKDFWITDALQQSTDWRSLSLSSFSLETCFHCNWGTGWGGFGIYPSNQFTVDLNWVHKHFHSNSVKPRVVETFIHIAPFSLHSCHSICIVQCIVGGVFCTSSVLQIFLWTLPLSLYMLPWYFQSRDEASRNRNNVTLEKTFSEQICQVEI